jgi:tRNA dimethylallyltransferase
MKPVPRPPTILIAGPTASGKSALALAVAERIGGSIVNADSMQVYRDLRVLTARPTTGEEARVPHHLFGHRDGAVSYSAGAFISEIGRVIDTIRGEDRVPIIVGGTGLYFLALTEGLAPIPPVPETVRAHWRSEVARLGTKRAHAILAERDPAMAARLSPNDPQRIARALEVIDATGRSLAAWQQERSAPLVDRVAALKIVMSPPRGTLVARTDARFSAMLDDGGIEEVRALLARELPADLPVMRAIGVDPIRRLLAGEVDRREAIRLGQIQTRQYVKRQETWLKRNMIAWKIVQETEKCEITSKIFPLIDG